MSDSFPEQSTDYAVPPPPPEPRPQMVQVQLPTHRPYVTYSILGLTILVYILQVAGKAAFGFDIVAALGMKINSEIYAGALWRLFTPMLLHASILHIGFNMYALYIIGRGLEQHYGAGRFLILYLLGGFAGNVFSFIFSQAPSLGASTAIFGLLGAEGILMYHNRKIFGQQAKSALRQIIYLAVLNLAIGLSPGIDNWAHVGGLLGGGIFAWLSGPKYQVEGIAPTFRLVDERQSADIVRAAIGDGLLFMLIVAGTFFLHGR